MSTPDISELKSGIPILSLALQLGIDVHKKGNSYLALCPFHEDHKPSLSFNVSENYFNCFSCKASGDVISLVERMRNVSFKEAVSYLQSTFNLSEKNQEAIKEEKMRSLRDPESQTLVKKVFSHYHETLVNDAKALHYLSKRGFDDPSLFHRFQMGYSNRSLHKIISDKEKKCLRESGILSDKVPHHETFFGFLTFPIIDEQGMILGCYGRRVNHPRFKSYDHHRYLKGHHRGVFNPEAFSHKEVILCESIIDALSLISLGVDNVTCSYGVNGFTERHSELLKEKGVDSLIIAYDNDEAGHLAANSLVEKLKDHHIIIKRLLLPFEKDINAYFCSLKPDERHEKFNYLIEKASLIHMPEKALLKEEKEVSFPSLSVYQDLPEVSATKEEVSLKRDHRYYRIKGVANNLKGDSMKVNIKLTCDKGFHQDSINLYAFNQREKFSKTASKHLSLDEKVILSDLSFLLEQVETIHTQILAGVFDEKEKAYQMSDLEREEALAYLKNPKLIEELLSDLDHYGLVGEELNKQVVYLCTISRKLDNPLAVMIQSRSSAGKSSLQDTLLKLVPEEDKKELTAMTRQSLYYIEKEGLKHKVLTIAESEGMLDASYSLKNFISAKSLKITSTNKDPLTGEHKAKDYEILGPTAILFTTTKDSIDDELANRCLCLSISEEKAQTEKILDRQRYERTLEAKRSKLVREQIIRKHQNAQRLLRPLMVVNHLQDDRSFPSYMIRFRRDFPKYLQLIECIAFLYQYQREIKKVKIGDTLFEYIEVTSDDVVLAQQLIDTLILKNADDLSPMSRRLLYQIISYVEERKHTHLNLDEPIIFTRKQIRDFIRCEDKYIKDHIRQLEDLGYLGIHNKKLGSALEYELLVSEDDLKSPSIGDNNPLGSEKKEGRTQPVRQNEGVVLKQDIRVYDASEKEEKGVVRQSEGIVIEKNGKERSIPKRGLKAV